MDRLVCAPSQPPGPLTCPDRVSILLIHANDLEAQQLRQRLHSCARIKFEVTNVSTLETGLQKLAESPADLVVIDLRLEEGNGVDLIRRAGVAAETTPVVALLPSGQEWCSLELIRAGAADAIPRECDDSAQLVRILLNVIERNRFRRDLMMALRREFRRARHDHLTGLLNKDAFIEALERSISFAKRYHTLLAVICIDLDGFKSVNDRFGHAVGDELIQETGSRILTVTRTSDPVGRLGGDEFAIAVQGLRDPGHAALVAAKLIDQLAHPCSIAGGSHPIKASAGISVMPHDGLDARSLMVSADMAMLSAKKRSGRRYVFAQSQLEELTASNEVSDSQVRKAIDQNDGISPQYRPIVDLSTGHLVGLEMLGRWRRPTQGGLFAEDFLPDLKSQDLAREVSQLLFNRAFEEIASLKDTGAGLRLCVNASSSELKNPSLPRIVSALLRLHGLEAEIISIEISESSLAESDDSILKTICALRDLGMGITIDIVASDLASFHTFRDYPATGIKVHPVFFDRPAAGRFDLAMGVALSTLAHEMGWEFAATGVSTHQHLDYLIQIGCSSARGEIIATPTSVEGVRAEVVAHQPRWVRALQSVGVCG